MTTCTMNAQLERDILARKQTQEALRVSEQRFRDYAETASDWLWSQPDHVFVYLSDQAGSFGIDADLLTDTAPGYRGRPCD